MLLNVDKAACESLRLDVSRILRSVPERPGSLAVVYQQGMNVNTSLYDVRKRRMQNPDELDYGWTFFDSRGEQRLRYKFDGSLRKYFCRLPGSDHWVPLDSTVKQLGLKFSVRAEDWFEQTADIQGVGADPDTLYVSTRLGTDTFQLGVYSLTQGVITRTIASHPKYDFSDRDDDFRLLETPTTRELCGLIFEGEKPRVIWWVPACAAAQKAVELSFPGQVATPISWAADFSTFIYFVGSDQNPGGYYAFRPGEAKLIPLFLAGAELKDRKLARTQPLDFPARDGVTIHAYLTLPPEPPVGPPALVVRIHGGPTARDSWGFDATNQFLATRGYAVLQVNYRGSSGYGSVYQKAGLQVRLDTVVLDDIADGVRHLIKAGTVDPARVAVVGASFGGWATYMSLIKYPDLYRAGVAISALSHFRQLMDDDRGQFDNYYGYAFWKMLVGRTDFSATEKLIDPLLRAGEIKQPIFIMHGERDEVVHATQAREMLKALQKTNPNVESMSFPYAGHSYWSFPDRVKQLNEIETFLRRHLAPTAALPPVDATASLTP